VGDKMAFCEICGKEALLSRTKVENTELLVCDSCSSFGEVIQRHVDELKEEELKQKSKKFVENEVIEIIVDGYSKQIKDSRNWMGLTQKEFAQKLSEKESVLNNIESGHMMPTIDLAKKIEKLCNIKLIEEYKEKEDNVKLNFKDQALTIGDLLKFKDEK